MGVFSERLKRLRLLHGKNQAEVAAVIGASVQSYSAYESGREPKFDMVCQLSNYFDVTCDYLLGRVDTPYVEHVDAMKVTGLSAAAVEMLEAMNNDVNGRGPAYLRVINYVLEEGLQHFLWADLYHYFFSNFVLGEPPEDGDDLHPDELFSRRPFITAYSEMMEDTRLEIRPEDFRSLYFAKIQTDLVRLKNTLDQLNYNRMFRPKGD